MSALIWWLIPLTACSGALVYVWWSINSKRQQNTYKSIAEYETFRSAFAKGDPTMTSQQSPTRSTNTSRLRGADKAIEPAPPQAPKERKKRRGTNEEQAR